MEIDIIVVGFGPSGAAAALEASGRASVLIIEKTSHSGGNAIISAGKLYGAGTALQRKECVDDSPQRMYDYLMAVGGGQTAPSLAKVIAYSSAETLDWLEGLGVEWAGLERSGFELVQGSETPRTHVASGGGRGLWMKVQEAVKRAGVNIIYGAQVRSLITGGVRGVKGVEIEKGEELIKVSAKKAVILATGGFTWDERMLMEALPRPYRFIPLATPASTGDGFKMALQVGADVVKTRGVVAYPAVAALEGPSAMLTLTRRGLPSIFVNQKGERFVNEELHYDYTANKIMEQERVYAVFDDKARKAAGKVCPGFSPGLEDEIEAGIVMVADNLASLADRLRVDPTSLEESVSDYNRYVDMERKPERRAGLSSLERPYYAVEAAAGAIETKAGVRIDQRTRVIGLSGEAIPGLYAPGRVAGGAIGKTYPGSGYALLEAFCLGRIAGREAACLRGSHVK